MKPVFCGNFEYDAREGDLERLFGKHGKVDRVDMKAGKLFYMFCLLNTCYFFLSLWLTSMNKQYHTQHWNPSHCPPKTSHCNGEGTLLFLGILIP
ncbi:unnamed protein product [Brassica oleracea var. botrytis]